MGWESIEEGLPENESMCWVYVPGINYKEGVILRPYRQDSFGLGELDFHITHYMVIDRPVKPSLNVRLHSLKSILLGLDDITADSLEPQLRLVR